MSLRDYAASDELGKRAEFLAFSLLLGPIREDTNLLLLPFAERYSILGVGLSSRKYDQRITTYLDSKFLPEGEEMPILEVSVAKEALNEIFPKDFERWKDVIAIGISVPQAHVSAGDSLNAVLPGTCGAPVTWGNKRHGILTAGHVASNQGGQVSDSSRMLIGHTSLSLNPASGGTGADVAVIELLSGVHTTPSFSNTASLTGGQSPVDLYLSRGVVPADVIAKTAWFYFPSIGGTYTDVYLTSMGVSIPGDSGGSVTISGTGKLVGHVVGGSGAFASYIQDITCQLSAVSSTPGFANISI